VLNVALLGAAVAAGALPFHLEDARKALTDRLAERHHALNLAALQAGAEAATTAQNGGI
jgi:Pyruvate/2-oxoacid:ferredoxin oxidoreductase gamma subunit